MNHSLLSQTFIWFWGAHCQQICWIWKRQQKKSEVFNAGRRQSKIFLILITTFSHFTLLTFSDGINWNRRALRLSWLKDLKNKTAALWQLLLKAPSSFEKSPGGWRNFASPFSSLRDVERSVTLASRVPTSEITTRRGKRKCLGWITQWQPKSNICCCTEAPLQCVVWSSLFKKAEAHVNRNPLAVSICSPVHVSFHYR